MAHKLAICLSLLVVSLLLAFSSASLSSSGHHRGKSANRGQIVFVQQQGNSSNLFLMRADGTHQRQLTHFSGQATGSTPGLSPDGKRIAYEGVSATGLPNQNIYLMRRDGTHRHNVSNNGLGNDQPSLSPNGRKIVYQSDLNFGDYPHIYVMRVDGTGQKQLTSAAGVDSAPTVSATGKRIAFTRNRNQRLKIYVMRSDGSHQRVLIHDRSNNYAPAYAPNGKWIAFVKGTKHPQVWIARASDGGQERQVTALPHGATNPSFAPGGRRIAFTTWPVNSDTRAISRVFTIKRDGTHVRRLTGRINGNADPNWGPRPR